MQPERISTLLIMLARPPVWQHLAHMEIPALGDMAHVQAVPLMLKKLRLRGHLFRVHSLPAFQEPAMTRIPVCLHLLM